MTAKGYWIARLDVHDTERYKDYIAAAKPAYQAYGAVFKVRGGQFSELEGKARGRNVVLEFNSYQDALDCYNSEQYKIARAIRQEISDGELIIIEGHMD